MNREIIIPTDDILPTITAIPVEVSNENQPVIAQKIALIISPPNIFKKIYNYYFKQAFTCQICSKIIPKAPGSLFAFFKYSIPKESAAYSLALLNAKNFLLVISGPIAKIPLAISCESFVEIDWFLLPGPL